jgi:beta-alanine degradation protein BauB
MSEVTAAAASKFANWPQKLIDEFEQNRTNGHVGSKLVSETDHVRVWHLTIPPHSRFGAHCHVLDYFWTAMAAGTGRSHYSDGTIKDVAYKVGDTKHLTYARGEGMQHDLENTGDTELSFVTVEFKDSPNSPLPL